MFGKESEGDLNAHAQQYLALCECNYAKLQLILIARTALSEDLGIGLAGRAMPWALQLVQDLVKELEMCSELAIHQHCCLPEPFVNLSPGELENLYPIDWAELMSEAQVNLYTDKQGNTALHATDALPTFKNDAKHLWVMEKNAEQAAKDKKRELAEAHRDVKTVQSVRSACAVQVAARKNQRQPKSLEFLEDSGDEIHPWKQVHPRPQRTGMQDHPQHRVLLNGPGCQDSAVCQVSMCSASSCKEKPEITQGT
ncbi:hypothetical protein F5J12DRAFT_887611 [Pisolithus orientalis]|uniref:uncharacterized protein n=1 Tax=Pisolithus orientalis TaxID=936130 RepID=UPI00222581EB|nr:uncharacterized protein F5J12DRAFT_887611 [Pisolithus orientalis]KAI6032716.1 hypothetical protein F5J12DRAFT_887611 [Pisolithus orientalis]